MAALLACAICALLLISIPAFAQSSGTQMPENSHKKTYGEGWDCDIGYRKDANTCAAVFVPENAYLTNETYGVGWKCLHGFHETGESVCGEVVVPPDGFLDPSGEQWNCKRGYLKRDDTCQAIVLPKNAYLTETSYRSDWRCNRGFEALGDTCTAIEVPTNAYLNASSYGRSWTCERGFVERGGTCEVIVIPANAYLDDGAFSQGWKCERGYSMSADRCESIDMPANAHLDRSGNHWECNRNFKKSQGLCVLDN